MELISFCHFYLSNDLNLIESYQWFKQFDIILLCWKERNNLFWNFINLKRYVTFSECKVMRGLSRSTIWALFLDSSGLFSSQQSSLCMLLTFLEDPVFSLFLFYKDSARASWCKKERRCHSVFSWPWLWKSHPIPTKIK